MKPVWPFRHAGLKLLSLALAVLLWIVVAGEETVERGLQVPLELQQFPANLEPQQGELPATVEVRLRGPSGVLSRISPGDVIAVLDLRTARSGRRLFQLNADTVRVPAGVEVLQITPSTVAMSFEPSASRQVPIVPEIDGKPAPGYLAGRPTTDPPTIEVVGPESAVRRVTEAFTDPVSVEGARAPVSEHVNVGFLDPTLRLKNPRPATVTVPIVPGPVEHAMKDRPVHLRNLQPSLSAEALPAVVTVSLSGARQALGGVQPDDVTAYVDVHGLGSGQYTLTVHADSSRDVGVTDIEPATIQVRISSGK
jgi:YbbR domain-containing protein